MAQCPSRIRTSQHAKQQADTCTGDALPRRQTPARESRTSTMKWLVFSAWELFWRDCMLTPPESCDKPTDMQGARRASGDRARARRARVWAMVLPEARRQADRQANRCRFKCTDRNEIECHNTETRCGGEALFFARAWSAEGHGPGQQSRELDAAAHRPSGRATSASFNQGSRKEAGGTHLLTESPPRKQPGK